MGRRRPAAVLVGLSALGLSTIRALRSGRRCRRSSATRSSQATPARSTNCNRKRTQKHGPAHRRPHHGHPARRQQGFWRRRPRHRRVPRQWRVLRAAQSLSARRCAAGEGGVRGAADLAGARRLRALAGRRAASLRLARLGIRHAQRAIIFRSETLQDPLLSGRDRKRRGTRQRTGRGTDGLAKGPYVAETFPVHVEDSYVIIET